MKLLTSVSAATLIALSAVVMAQTQSGSPMMGHSHGVRMQKMAAACVGKKINDPCSVTRADGSEIKGTCETRHERLFCIPAGMHHRHGVMRGMGNGDGAGVGGAATGSTNQ
jgi:hypothetical protein